jgi:hypothetical protein
MTAREGTEAKWIYDGDMVECRHAKLNLEPRQGTIF